MIATYSTIPPDRRMLVAVDSSPAAHQLAEAAACIARALDASITMLHVVRVPDELLTMPLLAPVHAELAAARTRTHTLGASLHGALARTHLVDLSSSPGRTIVERASAGDFDLVILGRPPCRSGATGASALVDYVIRHARCPVLTLPYRSV